jgi:uncharacterized protein (TIGR02246 family)
MGGPSTAAGTKALERRRTMRSRFIALILPVAALLAAGWFVIPGLVGAQEEPTSVEKALKDLGAAFKAAYEKGDADALAACFAPDAEYGDQTGAVRSGRAAIREMVAAFFETTPGTRLVAVSERLRVLSDTSAVKDGLVTVRSAEGKFLSRSRFTVLYTRHEGKWLIGSMRDRVPHQGASKDRMVELSWLVGDWMQETDAASISSTCRWSEDGPWLIQKFTVDDRRGNVQRSTQRIGWDPLTRKFKSWFWDATGGHGEALWTSTGNSWILQSRGVTDTGTVATGQFKITREGEDAFRWESTGRTFGEALMPDRSFFIVRRPPEPK